MLHGRTIIMTLKNINGCRTLNEFVRTKAEAFKNEKRDFKTLYKYMFSERENVFAEITDGYRIIKITYGQCADGIEKIAPSLAKTLGFVPRGSMVGLYMANSVEWIQIFWAILMCGYKPLLLNTRLGDDIIGKILADYSVPAVISDGKTFSVPTFGSEEIFSGAAEQPSEGCAWVNEIIFMSSGTSENIKLCVWTGENMYHIVREGVNVLELCPRMATGCDGELKQLALLPFYHVFGFIAVYVWFAFYSRTFVFLKDMRPQTLLNTVKRHKVTHIFAVPLVWETIYRQAMQKIEARGEKTFKKFQKGLKLASQNAFFKRLTHSAFGEVRENIFGDSIRFLISGGSGISKDVLRFFNGIGYHLANGYGMTEIGITSFEVSSDPKELNTGSIGRPFSFTEYDVNGQGELLTRSKTMASRILQDKKERVVDSGQWFNTHDLAQRIDGKYYVVGRKDDLIVSSTGENINPTLAEGSLKIDSCNELCLFLDDRNRTTLLVSVSRCYSAERLRRIQQSVNAALREAKLLDMVQKVAITTSKLLEAEDFKINRRKIAKKYCSGGYKLIDASSFEEAASQSLSELEKEVVGYFSEVLKIPSEEIGINANFFTDFGGTSLDYFALVEIIKQRFAIELPMGESGLATPSEICRYISSR